MKSVERIDINKRRPIPNWIKFLLLIMVIFGVGLRNCWKKSNPSSVMISDVQVTEYTISTIDVKFTVENQNKVDLKKSILIKVMHRSGIELASKLTTIEFPAQSKKRYLKVLTKLVKPVNELSDISEVSVEVYNP
jgi:hypothetical protein